MKQIYILLALCCLFQFTANSQCNDLFFSEYIEGSGSNKVIEIYNPTQNAINLGRYKVNLYSNGSATPNASNSVTLPDSVSLASGDVYIIVNANAAAELLAFADLVGGPANFNGDDAVELADTSGNSIDIIGVIGERENWVVGTGSTQNHTLVRSSNVNDGETDWTVSVLGWEVYNQDSFAFVGSHTIDNCDVNEVPPIVSFSEPSRNTVESSGSVTVDVNISNLTSAVDLEVVLDAASTATIGTDGSIINLGSYNFSENGNDTSITVTIDVTDDSNIEGDETFVLKLINVTTGTTISFDTYTLTILDDDVVQNSPCSDLFFSEYIEGSSNNKAIEIFNPSEDPIDLGLYQVNKYRNGDTDPDFQFKFDGGTILAPGEVYVIANSQADSAILVEADTVSNVTFFNGNDAMAILDTATQTPLDIIGIIGEDPGNNWPVDTGATSEYTLVRKSTVNEGFTNWAASSTTWDVYAQDSFTFLGSHTMVPCDTTPDPCEGVAITITGTVTHESADDANDGAIDITVSGTSGSYAVLWSNGNTVEGISGLADGEYCIVVTDINGCSSESTCFIVNRGAGACDTTTITIVADSIHHESLLGQNDGAIGISVDGGVAPYTFNWDNGATMEDIDALAPGDYIVTVKDSNDCEGTATFTINAGPDPCAGVNIVVSLVVTDESSLGANDGSIDATVSGGTEPYTYNWLSGEATEDISGLAPGDYTLTSLDANGCRGEATGTVEEATVGVNEITSLKVFNVFPNPVNDILNIELHFANSETVQVEITDLLGRNLVTLQPEQVVSKMYSIQPNIPAGIYFLKIHVNGSIAIEPFVVR